MRDDGGSDFTGADGVRRLAELAALELTDTEVERLAAELEDILEHIEVMRGGGAEGSAEGAADGAPLRADEPGADPLSRPPGDDAPGFEDGFFAVPRLASHAEERP